MDAPDLTSKRAGRFELTDLERPALESALIAHGIAAYRARQLFRWIHRHGRVDVDTMGNLPAAVRTTVAAAFTLGRLAIAERQRSTDGTEKFLLRLSDGQHIESVFIPDTPALTLCLSTQVGCAMACRFCLTGKMGLLRNLRAGEIAGQASLLANTLGLAGRPFNIVFMGMGEPLHNYEQTMRAVRILTDTHGLAVPARRITVSTVGVLPALERLGREPVMPNLAVSLHAPTDVLRGQLVPLNRKYGIGDILAACRRLPLSRRRRITFEYVLLAGVNDSEADARALSRLLHGLKSKVNLIPLNAAPGIPFERPTDDAVDRFGRALAKRGVTVSVRKSRGRDIRAACGQLIVDGGSRSAAQELAVLL